MAVVVKRMKNSEGNVEKSKTGISENGGYQSRKHLPGDGIAGMIHGDTLSVRLIELKLPFNI